MVIVINHHWTAFDNIFDRQENNAKQKTTTAAAENGSTCPEQLSLAHLDHGNRLNCLVGLALRGLTAQPHSVMKCQDVGENTLLCSVFNPKQHLSRLCHC